MERSEYDIFESLGVIKIPEGFLVSSLDLCKKKKNFTLTAESDVTIQYISEDSLQKYLLEHPERTLCINGTLNFCRSELLRRIFASKATK